LLEQAKTVSFCSYPCETAVVTKATVHIGSILEHSALLGSLHTLQANLSFPKSVLEAALLTVADAQDFKLKGPDLEDWKITLQKRIRNMCRCAGQSDAKQNPPAWIMKLPWRSDDPAGSVQPKLNPVQKPPPPANCDVEVGFNKELQLAFRRSGKKGPTELSRPIDIADTDKNCKEVHAVFANGDIVRVPGMTIGQLRLLHRVHLKSTSAVLWDGEMQDTHHKVQLVQKVVRNLLCILMEQSHQVLQVRVDAFGIVANQASALPREDPVLQKAVEFMKVIAEKFCQGKLHKKQLLGARDVALREIRAVDGKTLPRGGQRARTQPAAKRARTKKQNTEESEADKEDEGDEQASNDEAEGGPDLDGKGDLPDQEEEEEEEEEQEKEKEEPEEPEDAHEKEDTEKPVLKKPASVFKKPVSRTRAPATTSPKPVLKKPARVSKTPASTALATPTEQPNKFAMVMPMMSTDEPFERFWGSCA
jgi:hypothetical protein